MDDYQGKKPKQVEDSELFAFWGLVFFLTSVLILLFTK